MSQFIFVSTEKDDPFARLRRLAEGKHLRVYLTEPHPDSYSDDGHLLSAQLRGVAENGLVVTWNREAERVTELLPWHSIHRVVTRLRASRRGTAWGMTLMLALGTCGSVIDNIPGEVKTHSGAVAGIGIGFAVGLLVWLVTSELTVVYGSPKD